METNRHWTLILRFKKSQKNVNKGIKSTAIVYLCKEKKAYYCKYLSPIDGSSVKSVYVESSLFACFLAV